MAFGVRSGRTPLAAAENQGLSLESRFNLAKAHQKRNDAEYEGFVDVEERLVDDVIDAAHAVDHALGAVPPI